MQQFKIRHLLKQVITLTFILSSFMGVSQNKSLVLPTALQKFVPKGYTVLDTAMGDLNEDKLVDVLITLDSVGENASDAKRPLLVVLQKAKGQYSLAARNDGIVFCKSGGGLRGDPFQDLVINKGYFSVELSGGSRWIWTKIMTFKWSAVDKTWILHRIDETDTDTIDETSKVKKTVQRATQFGKILFTKFGYDHPKLKYR